MATETLRPNGAGAETNLTFFGAPTNWQCVDETPSDEDTSCVTVAPGADWRDLYAIADSGVGGTISNVRVYARAKEFALNNVAYLVLSSGGIGESGAKQLTASFADYYHDWATPPGGGSWDWDKIDALQAGVRLVAQAGKGSTVWCTQVWVVVTYSAVVAPTVTTQAVTNIGTTTATGNGNITDTGGENCSKRGVCWNTGGNPTVADDKSEETDSFGTGAFTRPMTGLTPGQHYYVKAYAYNSEGYGYGSQVEFYTNKDCTGSETGSGADAKTSGNPLATFPTRSETGSGVDAKKTGEPKAAYSRDETGEGVDGHKAVAPQSAGETGEGVDAFFALLYAMTRAETGSGVEHLLVRAIMAAQTGSGVDTVLALLGKIVTESGTGVENSYLHILEGVRDSSDSGSGSESSSLTTLFQRDETGEGVESVVARALFSREPQMGAIDLAKVITAAITGAETGTGAEASLVAYYQKVTESGEGLDSSELEALFTGEDSGAGAEAFTLLAAMVAQDTGVGVGTVLSFLRNLVDSGAGVEVVTLVGAIGRAMKLITYLRAYSDLAVYTKPYSDLRVYTSEVKQ